MGWLEPELSTTPNRYSFQMPVNCQITGLWNEYLFGVVLNSGTNQPITAALVALSLSGTTVRTYDVMSAAVLIGALPPLLVYFFGGKYFVRGLTQGAIK